MSFGYDQGVNQHNATDTQLQYWRQFTQAKEHSIYLHEYIAGDEHFEFWKNIVLAVGSSASIGAWVVWSQFPFIWAAIIALMQVIQAVSPFLPQQKRLKSLRKFSMEFDVVCLQIEEDWFSVSRGKLSEEQIHTKYIAYKKKLQKLEFDHLRELDVPRRPKHLAKAKAAVVSYFNNQYQVKGTIS